MPQGPRQDSAVREALIALGGNVASPHGPPEVTLAAAVAAIGQHVGPVTGKSRLWRTPCFPPGAGPDYVNAAVAVATALAPEAILDRLHMIEAEAGRLRRERWGDRPLDLDLLALGDAVLPDAATQSRWVGLSPGDQQRLAPGGLILPHPRLQDRAFVLVPLAEVAPDWRHPVTGLTVSGMLAALPQPDRDALRLL